MLRSPRRVRNAGSFRFPLAGALALLWVCRLPALAQKDSPLTPAPPRQVHRISSEGVADAPPLPPDQIVQAFVAREAECLRAHQNYSFRRTARLDELLPGGEGGGGVFQESLIYLAEDGKRFEKITSTSKKNFVVADAAAEDLKSASQIPLFPLVPDQMQYYNLTYKGSQPLDELHTYIFEVKPKRLLANYRLFQGLVYVDDRDLAIVQMYGRWDALPDDEGANSDARRVPFTMYEIYYENVTGKLWFPTYIRADAYLHSKTGDDQLRLIVKMTEFKAVPTGGKPPIPSDSAKPAGSSSPPQKPETDVPSGLPRDRAEMQFLNR